MNIAFFDVDGTLLAKPSLELRFFWDLHRRGKIPSANYFLWAAEALRDSGSGFRSAAQRSKNYLRGVRADILSEISMLDLAGTFPKLFPNAVQSIWRHAICGDAIVLATGSLEPLARIVKFALERELLYRGVEAKIDILATQLEQESGCWTGRMVGAPMFGEAKAFAIWDFAAARGISLSRCSAYGDSSQDRWMLESVGNAHAVNPTRRLRRIASDRGWRTLDWNHKESASQTEEPTPPQAQRAAKSRTSFEVEIIQRKGRD